MAGYMGFGMQSWIYKRKLRKPFSKRGKVPTHSSLPLYSRVFKLQRSVKKNKKQNAVLTLLIIFSLLILGVLTFSNIFKYEKQHKEFVSEMKDIKNQEAFIFLLNSGKERLNANNFSGAYSEFVLAYTINSQNEEVVRLLEETSSVLCKTDKKYCNTSEL
ncbi:hypothetical protein [uncultured Lacinutrix sp.]|uniref:hypothetical protein n=1 Tax=uncultured Lacinutrix sp. TaxID=574032 RepID=UPI0026118991|nr:hypothetical protein [uncultured Lacinutrix sp.]